MEGRDETVGGEREGSAGTRGGGGEEGEGGDEGESAPGRGGIHLEPDVPALVERG